jgi:subtilase family serine protease
VRRIELVPPAVVEHDIVRDDRGLSAAAARAKTTPKQKGLYTSAGLRSGTPAGCVEGREAIPAPEQPFTPNQFLTAYGHAALHARGLEGQGQTIAVVETGGFRHSDIATFDKCFGVKTPPIEVNTVAPVHKPLPPEDETTLDLETISVGAPEVDRIRVYEGAETPAGVLLTTAAALGKPGKQPNVISMSLGYCEPLLSGQLAVKRAFDNVLAIAAGAGISVLISAGDQGSSGCRAGPPGEERTELPILAVAQPSSSPYATAVGGTNFKLSKQNQIVLEGVWNDQPIASAGGGGGSSILTPTRPWWQRGIDRYGAGRIVPDIAALADRFPGYSFFCTAEGCVDPELPYPGWSVVGGTSAAAPLTAAGIALANQYAAERGQPPLGFLNPLLYRLGAERSEREQVFNDVTVGNNDLGRMLLPEVGGGRPLGCCSARSGYDWTTGWGSLKMVPFAKAAAALAPRSAFMAAG